MVVLQHKKPLTTAKAMGLIFFSVWCGFIPSCAFWHTAVHAVQQKSFIVFVVTGVMERYFSTHFHLK